MSDFVPSTDAAFLTWMNNYAAVLSAEFLAYGLTAADATAIQNAADAYADAFPIASDPNTRTPVAVSTKDDTRNAAKATARAYAQQIQANAGVSNAQLTALGLPIHDTDPTPVPTPSTSPILAVIGATPLSHTLRYSDQNTPDSRAKPPGAWALELWVHVGDGAVTDPDLAAFHSSPTRQPIGVSFQAAEAGKTATYFGRWVTRTGLRGPWSLPVAMTVADGGTVSMAA